MSLAEALAQRATEQVTVGDAHLPAHFGDAAAEYAAARDGAGLAHRALRALVRFSGEDRVKFLQGLLTNDVANLAPGRGCRSLFLDNKGHVRGVLDLWAGDEAIVAGCEQAFVNDVLPDLTRYILGADVQAADLRADKAVLSVLGPGADEVLQRAGAQPPADHPWAHCAARIADTDLWLARTPDLATAGVELHVPVDAQETVWEALQAAMGEAPATIGWQAAEALRVEAGGVRMGREISGEEFPQELLLDDAVNYEKGCYLGQETVARIHYRGQVNRLLSGLRGDGPLSPGAELVSSGKQVGRVTSAAHSPRAGAIGLALVRREESQAGATVQVTVDGETVGEARVVPLHETGG